MRMLIKKRRGPARNRNITKHDDVLVVGLLCCFFFSSSFSSYRFVLDRSKQLLLCKTGTRY